MTEKQSIAKQKATIELSTQDVQNCVSQRSVYIPIP